MTGPASAPQRAANRANAARSTGPRSAAGKAASSRNAWRHGLSRAAGAGEMAAAAPEAELLARAAAGPDPSPQRLALARLAVAAQIELDGVRRVRHDLVAAFLDDPFTVAPRLRAIDRYERYARTRRRAAIRMLEQLAPG